MEAGPFAGRRKSQLDEMILPVDRWAVTQAFVLRYSSTMVPLMMAHEITTFVLLRV